MGVQPTATLYVPPLRGDVQRVFGAAPHHGMSEKGVNALLAPHLVEPIPQWEGAALVPPAAPPSNRRARRKAAALARKAR